jgi:DNA-binding beta-propeller fold protein YncE
MSNKSATSKSPTSKSATSKLATSKLATSIITSATLLLATSATFAAEETKAPLAASPAIVIPGGPGKFDWMAVDPKRRRLLAAHRDKGTLEVLNLDTYKLIASVKIGACQGIIAGDRSYFAGDQAEHKVVILNAESLKIEGEVQVPGEIDALAYDPRNQRIYADHDDGADVWVIQPQRHKVVATIQVSGVPEFIEYDEQSDRLYQNIKTTNAVQVIDPKTNTIEATWSTAPAQNPHGLAIDSKQKRVFSAGSNGTLVAIDMKTGKVKSSVTIAKKVDQIAFDPIKKRVYCACDANISVVDAAGEELKLIENVPSHKGAHTLTVDPKTHAVWVSYADENNSYLQRFEFTNK